VRTIIFRLAIAAGVVAAARFGSAATFVVPPDRTLVQGSSAIIVASALTSRTELDQNRVVDTITTFSVQEVIKGDLNRHTVDVIEPGGVYGDFATIVPGSPRFEDGGQYLLFLVRSDRGWHVRDLALGKFQMATDVLGRRVAIRDQAEMRGWDDQGSEHRERRRDADQFLAFVKTIVRGGPAREDYFVPREDLLRPIAPAHDAVRGLIPTADAAASTYTMIISGSQGARWNSFPAALNWFSFGSIAGAPGGGVNAISAAFASWNGEPNSNVNLAYAGTRGSTAGLSSADGANTIAFERDLRAYGVQPFVCSTGGVLGLGGITSASGTHTGPESTTFNTVREGDVEMNQGLSNCTRLFTSGDINTAVAHEVGHGLGFRHSDQNRASNGPCAAPLECSTLAVMRSQIPGGINAALQTWDRNAVAAVYPGPSPPGPLPPRATFTDNPLVPGVTVIKSIHLIELRNAVNNYRSFAGLGPATFTGSGGRGVIVRAVHITELRTALNAARQALGLAPATFASGVAAGVIIRAQHFQELRDLLD
jgi:hypothetical protein